MNLAIAKSVDRTLGAALSRGLAVVRDALASGREVGEIRSILLVKLWGMGNIVLLDPVVREVRRAYPATRIVFLSLEANRPLLERHPDVDRVVTLDIGSWARLALNLPRVIRSLRSERPDLVCDFEQFCHVSGILAALSGAPQILGFQLPGRGRGRIYNVRVPYREERHMREIFIDIARAAGVPSFAHRLVPPELRPEEREEARRLVGDTSADPLVAIHPGSGDNFPGRRWPAGSFASVAGALLARRRALRVVLTGTTAERGLVAEVRGRAIEEARALHGLETADVERRAIDGAGATSMLGLAALLARCRLLLSNDTGPVHLAGAMGVPVFAFYGPNSPRLYGPSSPGSRAFTLGLPCSPCITNANGKTSSCRMPVCMRGIRVDSVLEAVEASGILGDPDPGSTSARPGASKEGILR